MSGMNKILFNLKSESVQYFFILLICKLEMYQTGDEQSK